MWEGAATMCSDASARGKYTVNDVPLPTSLKTSMVPPLRVTMLSTVGRPSPVPLPGSLVVKKGSKIRALVSPSMPQPLSLNASMM